MRRLKDRTSLRSISHGKSQSHSGKWSFHFSVQAVFRWMINVYCKNCSYNRENEEKSKIYSYASHYFSQESENTDLKRIKNPKIDPHISIYIWKADPFNSTVASSIFWKPCQSVRPKPQPQLCKYVQKQYLWEGLKSEVLDGARVLSSRREWSRHFIPLLVLERQYLSVFFLFPYLY